MPLVFRGSVEWNRSMLKNEMGNLATQPGSWPNVTRIQVSLEGLEKGNDYSQPGDLLIRNLNAKLYTETCETPLASATFPSLYSDGVFLKTFRPDNGTISGLKNYDRLIDYDDYGSMRMTFNGENVCCDMIATLPQLPLMYSAVIEANFDKGEDNSYSMIRKEYYLPAMGRERLDEHYDDTTKVTIKDFSVNKKFVIVHEDEDGEKQPEGLCYEYHMDAKDMAYETVQHHLQSVAARMSFNHNSAQTLFFGKDSAVEMPREEYHGRGHYVRGINTEMWSHNFSIPDPTSPDFNARNEYRLEHYFPVEDWRTAQSSVHRMLKRVKLTGTHSDGAAVKHTYEYIDMNPYIFDPDRVFNPCIVLEVGFGGNCTCSARELRVLVKDLPDELRHKANHHYKMEDVCKLYGVKLSRGQQGAIAGTAIALWIVGLAMGMGWMHYRSRMKLRNQQSHLRFKNALATDQEMMSVGESDNPWGEEQGGAPVEQSRA